jgi:circadian clock protein KaiC
MTLSADEDAPYKLTRVPTGIEALDNILQGGFFRGGVYIVTGVPGAGKTTLAHQIAFHHVAQGAKILYVTVLSETHSRLLTYLGQFAFFTRGPVGTALYYINGYETFLTGGLPALFDLIHATMRHRRPELVIIDSLPLPPSSTPDNLVTDDFVHKLQVHSEMSNMTSLVLAPARRDKNYSHAITMADGHIELGVLQEKYQTAHRLIIHKLRGSAYLRGTHLFEITPAGIVINPPEEVP